MTNANKLAPLMTEKIYHVYNRAIGDEVMFKHSENYKYFLGLYENYITPVAHTYCYCLMPNHFHFLIRIRTEEELLLYINDKYGFGKIKNPEALPLHVREVLVSHKLSQIFSHLFNSYSQAYNKQYRRKGGLFMRPFKRKEVGTEMYFKTLEKYIQNNPMESGLCDEERAWPYSSISAHPVRVITLTAFNEAA